MSQIRRGQTQAQAQATSSGFPMMTASEILECLVALDIPAQMEDIVKPSAISAQGIYAQLLEVLMGMPLTVMDGPKTALLGMMEYKEMYSDALQFTMFLRHCRSLAALCGINNFGMADLTRPEAQRFRTCLSGILNFAKFRDERRIFQEEQQARVAQQLERKAALQRKLDNIEASIEQIAARNIAERPQSEEAQKRNDGLRSELLELRATQVKLSQEVEELKNERQKLMEIASGNNHAIAQLGVQTSAAKSRLVQSPDRIKRYISEMTSNVAAEKATLTSYQRKARELSNRLEVIASLEHDLKGLIDLEKNIEEQKGKVEEEKRRLSNIKAKLESNEIDSQNLESRINQLNRQLQNAEDKKQRQDVMNKEFYEGGKQRIDDLREEYKARSKERGLWQKQRDVLLAEQREIEGEMAAFINKHETEINELMHEYWTMRRQAEDYMNTMTVKLGLQLKA